MRCLICEDETRGTFCRDCGILMLREEHLGDAPIPTRLKRAQDLRRTTFRESRREMRAAISGAWSAVVDVMRWRWLALWAKLFGGTSAIRRAISGGRNK